jgi:hypothetical protein
MTDPSTIAAMERLRTTPPTSDQAMSNSETRRLTVVLPLPEVERLRAHLHPGESMSDLLRRVLQEVGRG